MTFMVPEREKMSYKWGAATNVGPFYVSRGLPLEGSMRLLAIADTVSRI